MYLAPQYIPHAISVLTLGKKVVLCVCSRRGREVGGVGCNRLVTSTGELTLGPFPCQLSPGGDFFVRRILDGSG